jgi:predicted membrane channel-forming protein YqfA (hemolysin III family)
MPDQRKLEAAVFVIAIISAMLIVPPIVYIFNQPFLHFGVPQVVLYLFGVWLVMIVGTALVTRRLPHNDDRGTD